MRMIWLPGTATAAAVLACDQATKAAVSAHLSLYESIPVIGQVVRITHVRNSGIAFGLSLGVLNGTFLTILTAVGVAAIGVYLVRQSFLCVGRSMMVGLILGGAMGNLLDRFRLGEVVDFLDVGLPNLRWPVFNVADSVVVIGVVLLMLADRRDSRPSRPPDTET
ncbi:MAG: signal peptidase II [Candidatus Eisenbacteria bacterium]|nr:signal peptidase II [Candidatus Eisenbacteria bacterium]